MDAVIVVIFISLFFFGCAVLGWTLGSSAPWWVVVLVFAALSLLFTDRRR